MEIAPSYVGETREDFMFRALPTFIFAVIALSACAGNYGGKKGAYAPKSSIPSSQSFSLEGENVDDCPLSANVTRYYDPYTDGSGSYRACHSPSSNQILHIYGRSHSTNRVVCLIPANDFDTMFYYGLRNAAGLLIYKCVQSSVDGVSVDFSSLLGNKQMNLLHAVDQEDLAQMLTCLNAFDVYGCPQARSYGHL